MRQLILNFLVFLGISIAFFGIAVILFLVKKRQKKKFEELRKRCSIKVDATIIKMERCIMLRSDPHSVSWVPTYRYYVDENQTESFETKGLVANRKKIFDEGQRVVLYYNPDQPEEIYVPEEGPEYVVAILNILSIVFGVSSIFPIIIYITFFLW